MKIALQHTPDFVQSNQQTNALSTFKECLALAEVCPSVDNSALLVFSPHEADSVLSTLGTLCQFFNEWIDSKQSLEFVVTTNNHMRLVTLSPLITPVICGVSLSNLNLESTLPQKDLWEIQMTLVVT